MKPSLGKGPSDLLYLGHFRGGSHHLRSLGGEAERFRHYSRRKFLPGVSQKGEYLFEIHAGFFSRSSQGAKLSPGLAQGIPDTFVGKGRPVGPMHFFLVKLSLLTEFVEGIPLNAPEEDSRGENPRKNAKYRFEPLVPGKEMLHPAGGEVRFVKLGIGVPEGAPPTPEGLGRFSGLFGIHSGIAKILTELPTELVFSGKAPDMAMEKGKPLPKDQERRSAFRLFAAQGPIRRISFGKGHEEKRKRPVEYPASFVPGTPFPGISLFPAPYPCGPPALLALAGKDERQNFHRFGIGKKMAVLHSQGIPNSSPVREGVGKGLQGEGAKGKPHHDLLSSGHGIQYLKPLFAVEMYFLPHPETAGGGFFLLHS
jgi:hypothetical protein